LQQLKFLGGLLKLFFSLGLAILAVLFLAWSSVFSASLRFCS
jgi:hypothetical protein